MNTAIRYALSVLLVAASTNASTAFAQSANATLQGTVTDSTGAVVPNATIHVQAVTTGVARDTASNADGFYSAPNLNAGAYKVSVAAHGFATKVENDVIL